MTLLNARRALVNALRKTAKTTLQAKRSRICPLVALIIGVGALAACASTPPEPIVRTVEISAPVAVSCVPDNLGGPPDYPDTDEALRAAPGPAERYQLLIAGREARKARAGEVEPVIALCRVP